MGGKALKGLVETNQVVRVNEEQLLSAFDKTNDLINQYFSGKEIKTAMPKYIKSKETFGDLDFIVGINNMQERDYRLLIKDLAKTLNLPIDLSELNVDDKYFYTALDKAGGSSYFFNNGGILSFSLPIDIQDNEQKYLQVDLIFTSLKNFEPSYNYLSNNDLSNFLGRLARTQGLKYGATGLYTEVYYNDMNANNDIHLTSDMKQILEVLDLDTEQYFKGFETYDEMLNYLAESKYFNPMIFDLDYRNHDARQRDTKRDTYKKMLEFCNDYEKKVMSKYFNETTIFMTLGIFDRVPLDIPKSALIRQLNDLNNDVYVNGIRTIERILLNDYDITFEKYPNYNTDIQHIIRDTLSYSEIKDYLFERLNINCFDEDDSLIKTALYFNQLKRFKEKVYSIDSNKELSDYDKLTNVTNLLYKTFVLGEYLEKGVEKSLLKMPYLEKFGKLDEYEKVFERFKNSEVIKQFFNGHIVSEIFGVKDMQLGNVMKTMKSSDEVRKTLNEFILDVDSKDLTTFEKQELVNEKIKSLVFEHFPTLNLQLFEDLNKQIEEKAKKVEKTLDI